MSINPTADFPFGNGMVLQRNRSVSIWGSAAPGIDLVITIQDKSVEAVCDENGHWGATLPPLTASVNETLAITDGSTQTVYKDVMVGEVWLAGGQSNMEFYMRYDAEFDSIVKLTDDPLLRFLDVPKASVPEQLEMRDYSQFGFWRKACPEDLQYFSAVSFYFASILREHLQVPVGVIGCNWGGTSSSCWMSRETLEKCGRVWIEDYENGLARIPDMDAEEKAYYANEESDTSHPFDHPGLDHVMYGLSFDELTELLQIMAASGSFPGIGPWSQFRPNGLYEQMLSRITPYTISGVIWYQGENDVPHADIYADMMCGVIGDWRRDWNEELPFLMVQLAPLGTDPDPVSERFPLIREQQEEVTRRMEKVYLASISDSGHVYDIHPKYKRPVGKRLAWIALAKVYGHDILSDAPEPETAVRQGNEITVTFRNAEGGLFLRGEKVNGLQLFDPEGKEIPSDNWDARVQDNRLEIHIRDSYGTPDRVLFAKTPYYQANLYNMRKIPAKPFELELNMHLVY